MRRSVVLLAGLAVVGALVIVPTVHAPLAHATPSAACSSFPGCEQIEGENTGIYIYSNGGGYPVIINGTESCYKPQFRGTAVIGTTSVNLYTYYNQDDRCLYWDSAAQAVYTAKNANGCSAQPNEEFFGYVDTSTGWEWYNLEAQSDGASQVYGDPCQTDGQVWEGNFSLPSNDCTRWRFPSNGG